MAAVGAMMCTESAFAQKRYVEEEEESDPSLALNRAKGHTVGDVFE